MVDALLGGYYWFPTQMAGEGEAAWAVLTCHDLGFDAEVGDASKRRRECERIGGNDFPGVGPNLEVAMTRQASMLGLVLVALAAVTSDDVLAHPPISTDDRATGSGVLFSEGFEDTNLKARGWYDGNDRFTYSDDAAVGRHSIQYHFPRAKLTPSDSSGVRHAIEPTEVVYLRFYLKLSPDWSWTGKTYGPHLLQFMTTENGKYHGPAASHLTLYVEPVNRKLRLAAQDIQNKDAPHGLTQGPLRGGYNGTFYDSRDVLFDDGKWHCIEAMFKLNSLDLAGDKPNPDGEVRGWVDGKLVIDRTDVVFRSTDFPQMKFNQFLMLPYFHDGVPHDQTLWIDELAVGTERIVTGSGAGGRGRP